MVVELRGHQLVPELGKFGWYQAVDRRDAADLDEGLPAAVIEFDACLACQRV